MQRSSKIMVAKCVTILSVIPVAILANITGPPPGVSGAPGESNCTECHSGQVNTTGLAIEAAGGTTYTPGTTQRIKVTINANPAAVRYGFQATARLASATGTQAGTFQPINSETQVICADERRMPCTAQPFFIEHSNPKTTNSFEFDWTPPATASGEIRFYAAGNAANGNQQNSGDRIFTSTLTLSPTAASGGRPAIQSSNGVQNGATFEPNMVSSSWTTIKGENLAQTTRIWAGSDFVDGRAPTELDGVKVNIDGKPASVYFISPTQINVQAPTLDRLGNVPVEVINRGGTSNTATGDVRRAAPGWFMFDPESRRYIAGTHVDGTFLGKTGLFGTAVTTRPAAPGNTITLYGANFGPTNPPMPEGRGVTQLSPLVDTPTVTIGGVNATISYGGGAPNLIGTYQFNIVVPQTLANGDHQVVVTTGGVRTQDNAFITVQR